MTWKQSQILQYAVNFCQTTLVLGKDSEKQPNSITVSHISFQIILYSSLPMQS